MTYTHAVNTCERKRTYHNLKDATDAVTVAFWYHDSLQKWYRCPDCNKFHLTTITHEY